jgi:hypothetical protein
MFGRRKYYCIVVFYLKTEAMPSGAVPSLFEEIDAEYWQ